VSVGVGGIDSQNLAIRCLSLEQPSGPMVSKSPLKQITLHPSERAHLLSTLLPIHVGILKLMTVNYAAMLPPSASLRFAAVPRARIGLFQPPIACATSNACGSHWVVPPQKLQRSGWGTWPCHSRARFPLLAVSRSLAGRIAPAGMIINEGIACDLGAFGAGRLVTHGCEPLGILGHRTAGDRGVGIVTAHLHPQGLQRRHDAAHGAGLVAHGNAALELLAVIAAVLPAAAPSPRDAAASAASDRRTALPKV
jgi:hypothetical protein